MKVQILPETLPKIINRLRRHSCRSRRTRHLSSRRKFCQHLTACQKPAKIQTRAEDRLDQRVTKVRDTSIALFFQHNPQVLFKEEGLIVNKI